MIQYIITIVLLIATYFAYNKWQKQQQQNQEQKQNEQQQQEEIPQKNQKKQKQPTTEQQKENDQEHPQEQQASQKQKKQKKHHITIDHALYLNSIQNFQNDITDFDYFDKYFLVSSKDKTIKLFDITSIKEQQMKFKFYQFKYDHATAISFSNDGKRICAGLQIDKTIEIFSFDESATDKNYLKSIIKFQNNIHTDDILNIKLYDSFIISVAKNSDTVIRVWDLKGNQLFQTNTGIVKHYHSQMSDKLLLVAGWAPDVKISQIKIDKVDKSYKELTKVAFLSHSTQVQYVSISKNNEKAMSISHEKNILRVWNLGDESSKFENTKLIKEFQTNDFKALFQNPLNFNVLAADCAYSNTYKKWIYAISNSQEVLLLNQDFQKIESLGSIVMENTSIDQLKFYEIKKSIILVALNKNEPRLAIFKTVEKLFQ